MALGQEIPDNDSNHSDQIYPSTSSWKDEDPLRLLNDYDPTGCILDKGNSCTECLKLVEIDAEIRDAYDRLQCLAEKRRMAKEDANHAMHDPIVPRLPTELVGKIFEEWVESFGEAFLPIEVNAEPSIANVPLPAPLILSAVCRKWRQISHNTPRLWATVNIVSLKEVSPVHQELIKQWLDRSGQQPLKIWLFFKSMDPEIDIKKWDVSFFEDLRACAARWHSLTLCIRSYFWPLLFENITQMAMLKRLVLWPPTPTYDDIDVSATISSLKLKSPWLEDLQVRFQTPFEAVMAQQENNLTTFLMRAITPGNFLELLRLAPNLKKCRVGIEKWYINPGPALPEAPVLHRTLSDLTINPVEARDMLPLLDRLSLPFLCDAHFLIDNREVLGKLVPFISRSNCSIRSLWLRGSTDCLDDQLLIQVLQSLPTIRKLRCSIFSSMDRLGSDMPALWLTDTFFKELKATAKERVFLPNLQTLRLSFYDGATFSFSWACFLDTLDFFHELYLEPKISPDNVIAYGRQKGNTIYMDAQVILDTMSYRSPYRKQSDWIDDTSLQRIRSAKWTNTIFFKILERI